MTEFNNFSGTNLDFDHTYGFSITWETVEELGRNMERIWDRLVEYSLSIYDLYMEHATILNPIMSTVFNILSLQGYFVAGLAGNIIIPALRFMNYNRLGYNRFQILMNELMQYSIQRVQQISYNWFDFYTPGEEFAYQPNENPNLGQIIHFQQNNVINQLINRPFIHRVNPNLLLPPGNFGD